MFLVFLFFLLLCPVQGDLVIQNSSLNHIANIAINLLMSKQNAINLQLFNTFLTLLHKNAVIVN